MKNSKFKTLFLALLFLILPVFLFAQSAPNIVSYFLNGQNTDTQFNPNDGGMIEIKLEVEHSVKFNTVAICSVTDTTCSRSTATKWFTQTSRFDTTFVRSWDGKNAGGVVVADGSYKIKATIKAETDTEATSIELSTPLLIVDSTISSPPNPNPEPTPPPSDSTPDTLDDGTLSAHENPVPVSQVTAPETFKVGAGRPRLASVHSPIIFRAETTGLPDGGIVRYQWSFGDGGSAVGEQATHLYHFPGEYQVVLKAVGRDGAEAVARTSVSVIQPVISFGSLQSDRVEIINRSPRELNLGGWQIRQGATVFTFPADTIIATGKGTTVPAVYLGFSPAPNAPITLTFPDATVALASVSAPNQESLAAMAESLRQLSVKLAAIKISRAQKFQTVQTIQPTLIPITPVFPTTTTSLPSSTTVALVPSMVEASIPVPKSPGFFARIKNWFGE
ncbi:MAG: PKD domain-containing protein [Candidatus Vogelbacteria bacterium]